MIRIIITAKVIYPFCCCPIWGCTCMNFKTSNCISMPWAWNALSIASDNRLDTTLISLPLLKGNKDKISTLEAGILRTCTCQWLLQTGKKSYTRIDDISINRSVGQNNLLNKWKRWFGSDSIVVGLKYQLTTWEIMSHIFSIKEHSTSVSYFMLFCLFRKVSQHHLSICFYSSPHSLQFKIIKKRIKVLWLRPHEEGWVKIVCAWWSCLFCIQHSAHHSDNLKMYTC